MNVSDKDLRIPRTPFSFLRSDNHLHFCVHVLALIVPNYALEGTGAHVNYTNYCGTTELICLT